MNNEMTVAPNRLLTVRQFSEAHPAFTVGSLRHFLFFRESNGLDVAVRRVGRKLLLSERDFFAWIEATNAKGNPPPTLNSAPPRGRPAHRSPARHGNRGSASRQARPA